MSPIMYSKSLRFDSCKITPGLFYGSWLLEDSPLKFFLSGNKKMLSCTQIAYNMMCCLENMHMSCLALNLLSSVSSDVVDAQ